MNNELEKIIDFKKDPEEKEKKISTGVLEKIGILESEIKVEKEKKKSLNERIEDLVREIEKINKSVNNHFSLKATFLKGLLQGLGIIMGSTILAGLLYSLSIKFIDEDFIKENTLKYILDSKDLEK
ncbi:MAG TPA: hypothetical protein EYG89_03650 [Bacteroidia bacterium]|nr:hypothetical protein [Bacteroidia bacterium]